MTDEGFNKPKKIEETTTSSVNRNHLPLNVYEVTEFGLPKVMCACNGTPRFLQQVSPPLQSRPARIVELSDELELPKASTKLEIVEVEKSEPIQELYTPVKCDQVENPEVKENFYVPSKFVVADKRVERGNILTNGTNLTNGNHNSDVTIDDSEMLEESENFELNCPLLEDSSEPILEPSL